MRCIMITVTPQDAVLATCTRKAFDTPIPLHDLQKAVDGYIEVVPGFETAPVGGERVRVIALCNEEGKVNNLPHNALATKLWREAIGINPGDHLVGNVVILAGDDEFLDNF